MGARPPVGRVIRVLWILISVMILSLGVISTTVALAPSPLVGIGFAASTLVFIVSLTLAGRITIAFERARRAARPPTASSDSFPILGRIFRRTPRRSRYRLAPTANSDTSPDRTVKT